MAQSLTCIVDQGVEFAIFLLHVVKGSPDRLITCDIELKSINRPSNIRLCFFELCCCSVDFLQGATGMYNRVSCTGFVKSLYSLETQTSVASYDQNSLVAFDRYDNVCLSAWCEYLVSGRVVFSQWLDDYICNCRFPETSAGNPQSTCRILVHST